MDFTDGFFKKQHQHQKPYEYGGKIKMIFDVERHDLNAPLLFDLVRNWHANTVFINMFLFIM